MEFNTPHICLQATAISLDEKSNTKQVVSTKIMSSFALLLCFLLRLLTTALSAATPYRPTDQILLSCGSESSIPDDNNRSWDGDAHSKYAPPNIATTSIASKPTEQGSSVPNSAPYTAARIFQSNFTYTFPVPAGPKFLRLYFFPAAYSDASFNKNESFFTVTANEFTLASNFSAYLASADLPVPYFNKEFIINVDEDNQSLNVTFSPSPNSFAFINGIEIVSMPDTLYFRGIPIKFVNEQYELKSTTALETLYRFNVGGPFVGIKEDTGMFREWDGDDDIFISGEDLSYTPHRANLSVKYNERTPVYTAPEIVYTTSRVIANGSKSLDWSFPIDSGFLYLLRLHFCEIQPEVTHRNERVFTISINNQTAEMEADVIFWTGGTGIPYFQDYVTWVSDDGRHGEKYLSLSLFPFLEHHPKYSNALLNGLEIFKLSDSNRSLAAANPDPILNSLQKINK